MAAKIIIIFSFLYSLNCFSFTEWNVEGSYSKKIFGSNRQNDQVNKTITGSVAFYLFSLTAIEVNYTDSTEETIVRASVETASDALTFEGYTTDVNNQVTGVGIRQAFAGQKSRIRPLLSIGYAKQKIRDQTEYRYKVDDTGEVIKLKSTANRNEYDSVFASFALQFKLTQMTSLSASVRTVFPAFEFEKAKDYTKYTVGLTWFL